jgi:reactive intermediate/imine deaminase
MVVADHDTRGARMRKTLVNPEGVAPPVGAYSHAVRLEMADTVLVFVSGQVALDESGNMVGQGDVAAQTEQVFRNLRAILEANGATFADVVKINSYLTDMSQLQQLRDVRSRYISGDFPASTAVGVPALFSPEAMVEVDVVAALPLRAQES